MKIKIINKSINKNPEYAKLHDAGMDLRASLTDEFCIKNNIEPTLFNSVILQPQSRILIPTDNYIELPIGFEAQIRPRSGLALKHGITVLNTPGTIDFGYQGNIQIILFNTSNEPFVINNGDRIAQIVFSKFETIEWETVNSFEENRERGELGFGHTGKE